MINRINIFRDKMTHTHRRNVSGTGSENAPGNELPPEAGFLIRCGVHF
jgi:hypothetical protein